jgi:hypothetical protein
MCRFSRSGGSQLDTYRSEIIELLNQNLPKTEIFKKLTALGYTGKMTALKEYSRKLIDEMQIQYTSRKNTLGVAVKPNKKPDVHYISSKKVLKYLWSGEVLPEVDIEYLVDKFPVLAELELCISHFMEIYTEKNPKLLDWFIAVYSQCPIKSIASFANGLKSDIDAVSNSVTSSLSNGFVEGIKCTVGRK